RISPPLSRSELHSAVQPAVNALGNHPSTTQRPRRSLLRLYVLPSVACRVKSGAGSPTLSSVPCAAVPCAFNDPAASPSAISPGSSRHAFFIRPPAGKRSTADNRPIRLYARFRTPSKPQMRSVYWSFTLLAAIAVTAAAPSGAARARQPVERP